MSSAYSIRTTIEIAVAVLLIFGVIYEDRIAEFEEKLIRKIKRIFFRNNKVINLNKKRPPNNEFKAV